MYQYLHDQTLRLANHGETMVEIAEQVELPPSLAKEWYSRGYYGTVNHDVKAVYQRYLGFFDGNPAHLHPHPPVEAARRYVEYMGGADAVLAPGPRRLRARRLPLGGRGGEPRGVRRPRQRGRPGAPGRRARADGLPGGVGTVAQLLPHGRAGAAHRTDIARQPVRLSGAWCATCRSRWCSTRWRCALNGPRAVDVEARVNVVDTVDGTRYAVWLQNAVLHHRVDDHLPDAELTVSAEHDVLAGILFGSSRSTTRSPPDSPPPRATATRWRASTTSSTASTRPSRSSPRDARCGGRWGSAGPATVRTCGRQRTGAGLP